MAQIEIRLAEKEDIRGILECLSELSFAPYSSSVELSFLVRKTNPHMYTYVLEQIPSKEIVGTASLIFEYKLSHEGKCSAYITDVVIKKEYQGTGLGTILIDYLIKDVKDFYNCYKITLNCTENLEKYYEKFGFKRSNIEMRLDL